MATIVPLTFLRCDLEHGAVDVECEVGVGSRTQIAGGVSDQSCQVPDSWLKNTKALQKYLELSYEYVKTLKPKPTKKKS